MLYNIYILLFFIHRVFTAAINGIKDKYAVSGCTVAAMQPERREPSFRIEPILKAMQKLSARGVNWLTRLSLISIPWLHDADAAFVLRQMEYDSPSYDRRYGCTLLFLEIQPFPKAWVRPGAALADQLCGRGAIRLS